MSVTQPEPTNVAELAVGVDESELTDSFRFDRRQLSTIFAALRHWQRVGMIDDTPEWDIATDGGSLEPMSVDEIDGLCEEINT
jgi:hypothetical protein